MSSYARAVVTSDGEAIDVPWWSFTKTVLAAAALALVRDGRLALDEPLPGRPYTLRQLLQHRAGLTDYGRMRRLSRRPSRATTTLGRPTRCWPAPRPIG